MSDRTLVVNIRRDSFDVYVGRAGKGSTGYFGNPHTMPGPCRSCGRDHGRQGTLAAYREYLLARVESDPVFRQQVLELRGKRLGCFCARKGGVTASDPHVCHGQVLAAWIEEQEAQL